MAKKIPQALKFTEGLDADLHTLANLKGVNYNAYVEAVLSNHVIIQKRAMREAGSRLRQAENSMVEKIHRSVCRNRWARSSRSAG